MLESQIERYFCKKIKQLGGIALKFSPAGTAGMPDRLVLLPRGRMFFVEFKAPDKKPKALQLKRAKELRNLGFDVFFVNSYELVDFLFQVVGF